MKKKRMDALAIEEQEKYTAIWNIPEYRVQSPSDYLTPVFLQLFQDELRKGEAAIDFGCGPGRSAPFLQAAGLKVHLVDICQECLDPSIFLQTLGSKPIFSFTQGCLWDLPSDLIPAEWILCFDVLEHLPEETIDDSLRGMSLRMRKGGLFSIYLEEDRFGLAIGQKLHLTIKPAEWWKDKIERYFSIRNSFIEERCVTFALTNSVIKKT